VVKGEKEGAEGGGGCGMGSFDRKLLNCSRISKHSQSTL